MSNNGDDNLVSLRGLRNSLSNTLLELLVVDKEIINLKEPDDIAEFVIQSKRLVHHSNQLLAQIDYKISFQKVSPNSQSVSSQGISFNCKLPKLEMQTFDANPLKWYLFWD